jgi:phosphoribosylformylglycinamidine synthase
MQAKIYITLKPGVLDPQGKAVKHSLETLGFNEVGDVRVGKFIELKLGDVAHSEAEKRVKEMCEKLLANTVIESYRIEII